MDLLSAASAPSPLIYEACAGGWPAALIVAVVLGVGSILWAVGDAGLFIGLATINDRRRRNRAVRRARRAAKTDVYAVTREHDARGPYLALHDGGLPFTVRPAQLPDLIATLQRAADAYQDAK